MKYLDLDPTTNSKGHPRSLNDLYYIQQGVFDLAHALASALSESGMAGVILQGCELTDDGVNYSLNSGYIYDSTEKKVYVVQSSTGLLVSGGEYRFFRNAAQGPDNPVLYESGTTFIVHKETSIGFSHTTSAGPNSALYSSYKRGNVVEAIANLQEQVTLNTNVITAISGNWVDISSYAEPLIQGLNASATNVRYRYRLVGKALNLNVSATINNGTTNSPSISIPLPQNMLSNAKVACTAHTEPNVPMIAEINVGDNSFTLRRQGDFILGVFPIAFSITLEIQ